MEWVESVSNAAASVLFCLGHPCALGVGVRLAVIDWREHRLPNRLVAGLAIVTVLTGAAGMVAGASLSSVAGAAIGALAFGGPILLANLISPATMGFGDVKLGAVLGLWIGWHQPGSGLLALLGAFVLAFPEAIWRLRGSERELAFGPYLILAAALAVALGFELP